MGTQILIIPIFCLVIVVLAEMGGEEDLGHSGQCRRRGRWLCVHTHS